jgi:transposase
VAALRWDRLDAPLLIDGPMDGSIFLAYVEQILAPCLSPGNIVVCDNLSCHKVDGVREAIEAKGAQIRYLPPYSPDLNPIEMAFSKLKTWMRKIAARDFDRLCIGVGSAISQFSHSDCRNYFRHANYATI